MNAIDRTDTQKIYLNLNEFRFEHPFRITLTSDMIKHYYNKNLTITLIGKMSLAYNAPPENIMVINGGDNAIDLITRIHSKKKAVILVPTYGMYRTSCDNHNVRYTEELELKTKYLNNLVFICNPNNPNGRIIPRDVLISVVTANKSSVFVVDETYIEFSGIQSLSNICANNLYVIRSLSKYYGLAGVRVGCIISSEKNINFLHSLFNSKDITDVSKLCAISAFEHKYYYDTCSSAVRKNKDAIIHVLKKKNIKHIDTSANFICVEGDKSTIALAEYNGLIFRDISGRQSMENYYRITIGNNDDTQRTIAFLSSL